MNQFLFSLVSSLESRHLLYLQLRKSILESHILCNDEELISLGGLALQSEVGDFIEPVSVHIGSAGVHGHVNLCRLCCNLVTSFYRGSFLNENLATGTLIIF